MMRRVLLLFFFALSCSMVYGQGGNGPTGPIPRQTYTQLPAGSGSSTPCTSVASSIQYNNGGGFGCVLGSAVANTGATTLTASADNVVPISVLGHSGTQSVPIGKFDTGFLAAGLNDNPTLFAGVLPPNVQTHAFFGYSGTVDPAGFGISAIVAYSHMTGATSCEGTDCAAGLYVTQDEDTASTGSDAEIDGMALNSIGNHSTGSTSVVGLTISGLAGSAGTYPHVYGIDAVAQSIAGGPTITNDYDIEAEGPSGAGSSTTTNLAGIHIEGMDPANAIGASFTAGLSIEDQGTGKFGIYEKPSLASNALNAFGIWDSPGAHQVHITDPGTLSADYNFVMPITAGTAGQLLTSQGGGSTPMIWTTPLSNPMTTLGDDTYGGASGAFTRLPGPTAAGTYTKTEKPSGGAATAETYNLAGVVPNPQTGTTYTYLQTDSIADRAGYTTFSNASAIAVTLPAAGGTGFASNWVNVSCDIGAGTATITPTTSTISYSNGLSYTSGASTLVLKTGQCAWIYSDNTNYFAIYSQLANLGTPTTLTLTNATGLPVSTGISGLGTNAAGSLAVSSTTFTNATTAVGGNACSASAATVTMTGATSSMVPLIGPSADVSGGTGWGSTGGLVIDAWFTSNTLNYKLCNPTAGSITPTAETWNVSAR